MAQLSVRRLAAIIVTGTVVGALGVAGTAQAATPLAGTAARNCRGAGGVLNNLLGFADGGLSPAILREPELGTPQVDSGVVHAEGSVSFLSWGSCSSQVAFQLQTKVCGSFGCNWITRNHGTWEFFWAHDDTGTVSGDVGMTCRPGTNSYRVHMAVTNVVSAAEATEKGESGEAEGAEAGAVGAELESDGEDGPVVKLTC
jgi:hypothetical protein